MISQDRCDWSCNSVEDPSGIICVQNKMENLNSNVSIMITGVNKSKPFTRHILAFFNKIHALIYVDVMMQNVVQTKN